MTMVEKLALEIERGISRGYRPPTIARSVLEALRDPTEDMTETDDYQHGNWSRRNIEAYIRSALAGEPR